MRYSTAPALDDQRGHRFRALLLDSLVRAGLVRLHDRGLGLDVDADGHVINDSGERIRICTSSGPCAAGSCGDDRDPRDSGAGCRGRRGHHPTANSSPAPTPRTDLYGLERLRMLTLSTSTTRHSVVCCVSNAALASLLECVRRDPDFAMAHAALALVGNEFDAEVNIAAHLRGPDRRR